MKQDVVSHNKERRFDKNTNMVCNSSPFLFMKATKQQQAVLDYIEHYREARGTAPSQREIQKEFGFASRNAVPKHLSALEKKGLLHRPNGLARSVHLKAKKPTPSFFTIPLLGAIPAGFAEVATEDQEPSIVLDSATFPTRSHSSLFALRVRGDSMIDAAIIDGDIVILEQTAAFPGDIVAALIDGESTLKRLIFRNGKNFLRAENKNYPDLLPLEELVIQGVFRGLVRTK